MPAVHFCTFGTDTFAAALRRIEQQARASGYFDTVTLYSHSTTPGLEAHAAFIEANPRGYGYWIWKPLVILDQMRRAGPEDIIVYTDAGSTVNASRAAKGRWATYRALVERAPHRLCILQPWTREVDWCKGDLLDLLAARNRIAGPQAWAGVQILKNTPENKALVEEWLSIMTRDNYHYVDDSLSKSPNMPTFNEHRHDQSVISLLMKQRGAHFIPDIGSSDQYPIALTQKRDS